MSLLFILCKKSIGDLQIDTVNMYPAAQIAPQTREHLLIGETLQDIVFLLERSIIITVYYTQCQFMHKDGSSYLNHPSSVFSVDTKF